jgi:hypothetical protein
MNRITERDLKGLEDRLNRLTNSPLTYSSKRPNGELVHGSSMIINIGHYHFSHAYGGVCLHRTVNSGGGVNSVLSSGHVPKRQAYNETWAFIRGLEVSNGN